MHSAEHILNQAMDRAFHCGRCRSAHIEKKKSKCDYTFTGPVTDQAIRMVEAEVNKIIDSDLPVTESYMTREEAQKRFPLNRLPPGAGDSIRLILVGNYDACPCVGPHVRSTSEIGRFFISSYTIRDGVLRIRYKLNTP
jgi:Ser-tRNA(Ala) deacylase AlaX